MNETQFGLCIMKNDADLAEDQPQQITYIFWFLLVNELFQSIPLNKVSYDAISPPPVVIQYHGAYIGHFVHTHLTDKTFMVDVPFMDHKGCLDTQDTVCDGDFFNDNILALFPYRGGINQRENERGVKFMKKNLKRPWMEMCQIKLRVHGLVERK